MEKVERYPEHPVDRRTCNHHLRQPESDLPLCGAKVTGEFVDVQGNMYDLQSLPDHGLEWSRLGGGVKAH